MKHFKNEKNKIWGYDNNCFDEKGNCVNEDVKKAIEKLGLVEITEEEAEAIRNYKTAEELAEDERLAKLPSQEEILNDKITLKALKLIAELGLVWR